MGSTRYVSEEEEQFLAAKKSAYESVLAHAAKFMKRESFLWVQNNMFLRRAEMAEKQVLELKGKIEAMEDNNKVVPLLQLASSRGDGPWLMDQPEGAMIVIRDNDLAHQKDFNLPVFTIVHKTDRTVRICNPTANIDSRVDPVRFCNRYSLVEVLCIVDIPSIMSDGGDLLNKETEE